MPSDSKDYPGGARIPAVAGHSATQPDVTRNNQSAATVSANGRRLATLALTCLLAAGCDLGLPNSVSPAHELAATCAHAGRVCGSGGSCDAYDMCRRLPGDFCELACLDAHATDADRAACGCGAAIVFPVRP